MRKTLVIFLLLVTISMGTALASNRGSTGLINIPTADVIGQNALSIGYNQFGKLGIASLNYGFLPNLEVGAATINPNKGSNELLGHVKLQLNDEERDFPAVAVGLEGDNYYVAASKHISGGLRGHIGLGSGRFDGVFFGASLVLNPVRISTDSSSWSLPVTTLQAEYDGQRPNIGLNFAFTPELVVNVSAKDFEELNLGVGFTSRF
ncbi:MAG: YjbH domain-containing protein [Limnochordia bacterium]